jgi:hypothetical protein
VSQELTQRAKENKAPFRGLGVKNKGRDGDGLRNA